ncbi:MAG: 2-hydroxychromene-2-carboxylate isomerase, partial [Rhodospirillaceae bacterium]|nr:2-hydroxychromene-2-carboxylate isomerase [Rhodospirillaceae bacterium]
MSKVIDYYFSITSPWTYMGGGRLIEIAERHGATITYKPVDLGGKIFPISGGLPLPKRPLQRQAYRLA